MPRICSTGEPSPLYLATLEPSIWPRPIAPDDGFLAFGLPPDSWPTIHFQSPTLHPSWSAIWPMTLTHGPEKLGMPAVLDDADPDAACSVCCATADAATRPVET